MMTDKTTNVNRHIRAESSDPVADDSLDYLTDWQIEQPNEGRLAGLNYSKPPERMVGMGFRCWVRGVQSHDLRYFDACSQNYIQFYGLKDGVVLSTKLGNWVNALERIRQRRFQIQKIGDAGFSYDEVIAISMIAACQHSHCPALKACIYAMTEASDLNFPTRAAQDFADGLIDAGQILKPYSIAEPLQHLSTQSQLRPN